MIQEQFEAAVVEQRKSNTIRPPRKDGRDPKPGDELSIRVWTGKPYRSPQREVFRAVVSGIKAIQIFGTAGTPDNCGTKIHLAEVVEPGSMPIGRFLDRQEMIELAIGDGFDSLAAFREFFETTHGLPFSGFLIKWRPQKE